PGTYFLKISAIGFVDKKTEAFELASTSLSKRFEIITLQEDVKTLREVSVTALRPSIEQKADRLVVSVEGTAMAAGNTAFAVLSRAPGVFVDAEGNIQLNGSSGVTIMLDGKLTYLSARDLRTMLEGMSAENLKNIESITNPSAKYDAEGTSGIININLKKNTQQGINGSVYTGYNYNFSNHGYSAGGNINFKSGKWNSFLNLDFSRRVGGREATFTRIFYGTNKTTYFDQVATGNFSAIGPPSVRAGADYNINDRHSVGFTTNLAANNSTSDFLTETFIGSTPGRPTQFIDADNFSDNEWRNFTINGHYAGKFDTLGTNFSTDIDFVKIRSHNQQHFYNYFTDLNLNQTTQDFLYTDIPSGFDIYSAKIDFAKPFTKDHKMEIGAKASRVVSDNDSRFYFNNSTLVLDPRRTNHFNYKENIYAAYVNFNGKLNNQFIMQAGLRAEKTESIGNSFTTGQVTPRDYLNFFPSIFLQQKISPDYGLNYSYSRRLTRPNYGNLNPFIAYRDPYTYIQGNPYLRPQYT
ncbi:MAG: TonB-dependent receptor domain-containing protein, partial [Chitinophagaceae bacterium]